MEQTRRLNTKGLLDLIPSATPSEVKTLEQDLMPIKIYKTTETRTYNTSLNGVTMQGYESLF